MPSPERGQKLAAALAALTALLAGACNDERVVASRYLERVLVRAQAGAFIQITAEDSPELAGTSLEIAPDALAADTFITVELSQRTIAREPAGPAVAFGPSGIMLRTSSRLSLPFNASRPDERVILEAEEENGQRWAPADPTEIEGAPARLLTVSIQRLAVFQAGWPPPSACPSAIISEAHAPAEQSMDVRSSSARRSSMNARTRLGGMLMAGCLLFGCAQPQDEPVAEQSDLSRSRHESCPPPPPPRPTPALCANPAVDAVSILQAKCVLCHSPETRAANLDLITPGAKARVLNVSSTNCPGRILVTDGAAGVGGLLFDKIAGATAACGTRMPPIGSALTAAEVKCLKDWIRPSP